MRALPSSPNREIIPESLVELRDWLQSLHDDLGNPDASDLGFTPAQIVAFQELFRTILAPMLDRPTKLRELETAHRAVMMKLQEHLPGTFRKFDCPPHPLEFA